MGSARILTIDGGGVRGVIPAVLMQRLGREPGLGDWLDRVEFVAGTSTGGLIALMLAAELDPQAIRDLYEQRARHVFADSIWDDIRDLGKIFGADYDVDNLRQEARSVFGDRTLEQLTKRVLVTTFDLDNEDPAARTWKPKIFHNFEGPDSDGPEFAYKVATYTTRRRRSSPARTDTSTAGCSHPTPPCARSRRARTGATSPAIDPP